MKDGTAFALSLLAALCAENIPLMLGLTAATGMIVMMKGVLTMHKGKTCDSKDGSDLRRRCHNMLDILQNEDLEARAYRFIKYLYIYGDKKRPPRCCEHRDGQSGI